MTDLYHRAAKDGYLAPLKQATKKDLNQSDEDGMTPTLYAAYHGNLDALRLCCSRGGDPDRCDYTGNTALHFAAANGYLNCLMFLVSFGANVWQMDNDYHTIMDIASIRGKQDCVRYLDGVIAKQQALDKKMVTKLQEKAKKDADKRIEKYQKLQDKLQSRILKEGPTGAAESDNKANSSWPWLGTRRMKKTSVPKNDDSISYSQATFTSHNKSNVQKKINKQKKTSTASIPDQEFLVSEGGRQTARSINGVTSQKLPSNVMYVSTEGMAQKSDGKDAGGSQSKRKMLRNLFQLDHENGSFDRVSRTGPGIFGTIALRTDLKSVSAMYSALDAQSQNSFDPSNPSSIRPPTLKSGSIGSAGSLVGRGSSEDDDDEEVTPLDTFLASLDLSEYSNLFKVEKMDMDALTLCSSEDLKEMELPLGPRKKILAALEERKAAIQSPVLMDLTQF